MDIKTKLDEKIKLFEDYKKQIMALNQQIGALQEQGQAIHQAALEVRGAIDALSKLAVEQEAEKKVNGLILPDKAIVAPDGKTVVVEAPVKAVEQKAPEAPAAETPAAPITLEVK